MSHAQHPPESARRSPRRRVSELWAGMIDPARIEHVILTSVASGALALVDPARRGRAGRFALHAATAALSGFVVWADIRRTRRISEAGGYTAASIGATLALAEVGDAIDARVQRLLVRSGARHPRIVLALGGTALMAIAQLAAVKLDVTSGPSDGRDAFEDEEPTEMPEPVRDLVSALLSHAHAWGEAELTAQLAEARAIPYIGEDEEAFYPGIGFDVPDALPRAVPGDVRFPVVGRYHPFDGRSADVYLSVWGGKLANLTIAPGDDWTGDELEAWSRAGGSVQSLDGWPTPDELTLLVETPSGLRPLL